MTNAHSWIDSAEIFAGRKHRVGYQSLITDRQAERLSYNTANGQSGSGARARVELFVRDATAK